MLGGAKVLIALMFSSALGELTPVAKLNATVT